LRGGIEPIDKYRDARLAAFIDEPALRRTRSAIDFMPSWTISLRFTTSTVTGTFCRTSERRRGLTMIGCSV
jgi:hypothetical protein